MSLDNITIEQLVWFLFRLIIAGLVVGVCLSLIFAVLFGISHAFFPHHSYG